MRYPSLPQKGVGYLAILAILCGLLLVGCSARRPITQISDAMDKVTAAYFAAEQTAVALHDAGILKGEKWEQVVEIRNQVSPIMRQLWARWALLPDSETALQEFLHSPDYEKALTLIAQLTALIGS